MWQQLLRWEAPRVWLQAAGASGTTAAAVSSHLIPPLGNAITSSASTANTTRTTGEPASSASGQDPAISSLPGHWWSQAAGALAEGSFTQLLDSLLQPHSSGAAMGAGGMSACLAALQSLMALLQRCWHSAGAVPACSDMAASGRSLACSTTAHSAQALLRNEVFSKALEAQCKRFSKAAQTGSAVGAAVAPLLPMLRCLHAAVAMNAGIGVADSPVAAVQAFLANRGMAKGLVAAAYHMCNVLEVGPYRAPRHTEAERGALLRL